MPDGTLPVLCTGEDGGRNDPHGSHAVSPDCLACVLMAADPPQLLILDEPTNHLDLDSIEAVEDALADYDGALLIASHDDDFLDAVGVERRIALPPG